jgi:hypothetical protein
MEKEIMHRLEIARDSWRQSAGEEELHKQLKLKSLALASFQRMITQQELRILWLSEGDVPTHSSTCMPMFTAQGNVLGP